MRVHMAVGQNLRYLFGDDYPQGVYFKGFWDVHWGTGVLTHCHMCFFHVSLLFVLLFTAPQVISAWLDSWLLSAALVGPGSGLWTWRYGLQLAAPRTF